MSVSASERDIKFIDTNIGTETSDKKETFQQPLEDKLKTDKKESSKYTHYPRCDDYL